MRHIFALALLFASSVSLAQIPRAPDRQQGEGPYPQLILRGVNVVAGTGSPMRGPMDIVIEGNRIVSVTSVGSPGTTISEDGRPKAAPNAKSIDLRGHTVMPGFIDMHGHIGGKEQGVTAEYVYKLWLAHGITTIRDPSCGNGLDWCLEEQQRSQNNAIAAPRIHAYPYFGSGSETPISTPDEARRWVRQIAKEGAQGIKFFGAAPKIMQAALDEAQKQGLGTAMHHAQVDVYRTNVLDTASMGLTTMEHWYGLPEAMFEDKRIQDYPSSYNYNDEAHRFGEAGKLWEQTAEPGSEAWIATRDQLLELDFTLDPTFTIYEATRDWMRERRAEWHDDYTHPNLWKFFQPDRNAHGSFWFDWTTSDEIAWKRNYAKWMQFVNEYKNHGGRVTSGSDSGYLYKTYGFGYIRELELLQEAGFHPLEVIQAATLSGAQALGVEDDLGSIEVGKLADLVIVEGNPLANFKLLYGTGHLMLNQDNELVRAGGVKYTVKDGIIYDAKALLADVKAIVAKAQAASE